MTRDIKVLFFQNKNRESEPNKTTTTHKKNQQNSKIFKVNILK